MTQARCSGSTRRVRAAVAGAGIGAVLWWGGQATISSVAQAAPADSSVSTEGPTGSSDPTASPSTATPPDAHSQAAPAETPSSDAGSPSPGSTSPGSTSPGSTSPGSSDAGSTTSQRIAPPATPTETDPPADTSTPSHVDQPTGAPSAPSIRTVTSGAPSTSAAASSGDSPHTATPRSDTATPRSATPDSAAVVEIPTSRVASLSVVNPLAGTAADASATQVVVGSGPAPVTTSGGVRVVNAPTKFIATLFSVLGFNPLVAHDPSAPAPAPALVFAWAAWQQVNRRFFNSYPTVSPSTPLVDASTGVVTGSLGASDPDGDVLTYTVLTQPEHGTVVINPDGTYTYTPDPAYAHSLSDTSSTATTTDSFAVSVSDDTSSNPVHSHYLSATTTAGQTASVVVPITPENQAPTLSVTSNAPTAGTIQLTDASWPAAVTVSSNGKYAFVGDVRWNRVVVVDADPASPTYNQVVTEVSSHRATGVAVTPDGKTLYVADSSPYIIDNALRKFVNVIDLDPTSSTMGTAVARIAVPDVPVAVTLSPDGNTLYTNTLDGVVAIDVRGGSTQGTVIATYPSRPYVYGVAVSPDNTRLYLAISDSVTSSVCIIDMDPASSTYQQEIATIDAIGVTGAAVSGDGKLLYVSQETARVVSVIDVDPQSPTYQQVLGTYAVSAQPNGVALTPDGTRLYTANSDATLSVIPTGVVTGTAHGSDADGDTLAYSVSGQPAHGAVVIDPTTGTWTYSPDTPGSTNPDSFVITVDDGHGGIASQAITINAPAVSV